MCKWVKKFPSIFKDHPKINCCLDAKRLLNIAYQLILTSVLIRREVRGHPASYLTNESTSFLLQIRREFKGHPGDLEVKGHIPAQNTADLTTTRHTLDFRKSAS